MSDSPVLLEKREDRVAVITLNRPDKLNALNAEVRQLLRDMLDELEHDEDVRAVVIHGAGEKAFVAGADVTEFHARTVDEQRAVYEIVLEAQQAAIEKTVVGNHWNEPHDAAVRVITKGLKKLGLLDGLLPKLIKDGAYRQYYMHRTGHWIGMDVHDVGDYKVGKEWRMLESGMVTTVEPGIYIGNSRKVPKAFRNIGIRIEDDVAVTSKGPDVLSKALVSDPDDIESLMSSTAA